MLQRSLLFLFILASISSAQVLGTKYFWSDSIKVNATGIDCTFVQRWESISFWFDGCDALVKLSAPDTVGFASRKYMKMYEGVPYSMGPATPVKRLKAKAAADSGTVYFAGYKTTRQM